MPQMAHFEHSETVPKAIDSDPKISVSGPFLRGNGRKSPSFEVVRAVIPSKTHVYTMKSRASVSGIWLSPLMREP